MVMYMIETPFKIVSFKHDGRFHRSWEENDLLYYKGDVLIGSNQHTLVTESKGSQWYTKEPALFYFHHAYWFNIIILFTKDDYYFYCNISSPFTWHHEEVHYIDYDIDIIVRSNLTYTIVDRDEYNIHKRKYNYPSSLQQNIEKAIRQLMYRIKNQKEPFSPSFINKWSSLYFDL